MSAIAHGITFHEPVRNNLLYTRLYGNGRHCSRCFQRSDVFGSHHRKTGWEGWCRVCNVEWMTHSKISSHRSCSHAHARLSDNLAKYVASLRHEWGPSLALYKLPGALLDQTLDMRTMGYGIAAHEPVGYSMRYSRLYATGMYCKRCFRRSDLFGSKDHETGWEGWCKVCNAEWMTHSMISSYRCCNQAHATLSDSILKYVASFLWVKAALIHRLTIRQHKSSLQLLEWFCIPLNSGALGSGVLGSGKLLRAIYSYLAPGLDDAILG
jgi:hypothetical protein